MGTYIKPPDSVKEKGRSIQGHSYAALVAQLNDGEVLVGLYDRYMFKNAPHLDSEAEYNEFEDQYRHGIVKCEGFYAVPCKYLPYEWQQSAVWQCNQMVREPDATEDAR